MPSRFFPHSAYAEDQLQAHTILWTHVLYRGFQSGVVIGLTAGSVRSFIQTRKAASSGLARPPLTPILLRSVSRGAMGGTLLMVPALIGRMSGRDEIEWKDRSWRLLENQGQMEVDDWSALGAVAGVMAAGGRLVAEQGLRPRLAKATASAGVGSLAGVAGYLAWRYGVHGGHWD